MVLEVYDKHAVLRKDELKYLVHLGSMIPSNVLFQSSTEYGGIMLSYLLKCIGQDIR